MPIRLAGPILRVAIALALVISAPLHSQSDPYKIPKRPKLDPGRDTNSASDYFFYGNASIGKFPERAAAAYYWASRLDPAWADPLYGRYVALLLAQPTTVLHEYLTNRRSLRKDKVIRGIDSLKYQAFLANPFVDRRLDGVLLTNWLERAYNGQYSTHDLKRLSPELAGWISYTYGRFQESAAAYAEAINRDPHDPWLHMSRALPLIAMGLQDSALMAVRTALDSLRGTPDDKGGFPYESYPFAEYSVGVLFERMQARDSAQAAYERALLDDISFYPAHRKLARLRLAGGDTSGALKEYADAANLAPNDAVAVFELGTISLTTGRTDSALVLLKRSIELEPLFLPPRMTLGLIYEQSGFKEEAIREYSAFVRQAPRGMESQSAAIQQRLKRLGSPSP
jgi:tetratricopeptide (TPR) repeat protein